MDILLKDGKRLMCFFFWTFIINFEIMITCMVAMRIHACMCAQCRCRYVCMYVCMYAYVYVCMYVCMCMRTCMCVYVCMYVMYELIYAVALLNVICI